MLNIVSQFNYLDIIILILLFRICYVAIRSGFVVESFKLLGVLFSIYIASHYYTHISDIARQRYIPKSMPLAFADFIIFLLLVLLVYLLFVLLRIAFYRFLKMEAAPNLNRYGGILLGLIRWFFTTGLAVYILMISSVTYLGDSVKRSYLGSRFSSVSADTYSWLWGAVFSKFSPQEKMNPVVNEVKNSFSKK